MFVGIDGGGTSCRARLVADDGRTVGEGVAGPANTLLGIDRALGAMVDATVEALRGAGLDRSCLSSLHAGAGLAGLTLGSELERLRAAAHPFASLAVESDAYVACLGAHDGADGGILVLGTGSCGCAIVGGRAFTVGGWGFLVSDQASGATVGREAVRAALLAHESVVASSELGRAIMARFDDDPERVVAWAIEARPADYGELAPLVVEHARRGDAIGVSIMRAAAADAAALLRALHAGGAPRIALVGGFSGALGSWLPEAVAPLLVEPRGDALDGALAMALARSRA